jgi:hypothetical protein
MGGDRASPDRRRPERCEQEGKTALAQAREYPYIRRDAIGACLSGQARSGAYTMSLSWATASPTHGLIRERP